MAGAKRRSPGGQVTLLAHALTALVRATTAEPGARCAALHWPCTHQSRCAAVQPVRQVSLFWLKTCPNGGDPATKLALGGGGRLGAQHAVHHVGEEVVTRRTRRRRRVHQRAHWRKALRLCAAVQVCYFLPSPHSYATFLS